MLINPFFEILNSAGNFMQERPINGLKVES